MKPREFWIVEIWDPVVANRFAYDADPEDSLPVDAEISHVISKWAYDKAVAALKKIVHDGIDTSSDGGIRFVKDALKELGEVQE